MRPKGFHGQHFFLFPDLPQAGVAGVGVVGEGRSRNAQKALNPLTFFRRPRARPVLVWVVVRTEEGKKEKERKKLITAAAPDHNRGDTPKMLGGVAGMTLSLLTLLEVTGFCKYPDYY